MISTLVVLLLPPIDNTVLLQHLQHLATCVEVCASADPSDYCYVATSDAVVCTEASQHVSYYWQKHMKELKCTDIAETTGICLTSGL